MWYISPYMEVLMLKTHFSQNLNPQNILPEYPRPNLRRNSYINLNGHWNYLFSESIELPVEYEGKILVPFPPESAMSGVNRRLNPNEYLWYQKDFTSPISNHDNRLILHFGAVDQTATIYINNHEITTHHGGYLPFSVDITDFLREDINSLVVRVKDVTDTSYHSRGKQKLNPSGMFYTPVSGIWQTVWMECVPSHYLKDIKITPLFDEASVHIKLTTNDNDSFFFHQDNIDLTIYDKDAIVAKYSYKGILEATIKLSTIKEWSPDSPFLYDVKISYQNDSVMSYFAMRKFSCGFDENGVQRLFLNNKPYFHNGLLDQGYWPESLYTPPSDAAMIYDILTAKNLGFNMLRKHAKIEPLRWYYHCDKIGMLVWQDMINGGSSYHMWFVTYFPTLLTSLSKKIKDNYYHMFSRSDAYGREDFLQETKDTIQLLYNFPCVAMWVLFNEGWGQFDALQVTNYAKSLDSTRTIDSTSGWFDQNVGDVKSLHIYFTPLRFKKEKRTVILSEFGGYALKLKKHSYSDKMYGYRIYRNKHSLQKAYNKLFYNKIIPGIKNGLSACVYTQLTDIEEEINGIMTYDRKVLKVNDKEVNQINKALLQEFNKRTVYARKLK